jgi:hypothetical protein
MLTQLNVLPNVHLEAQIYEDQKNNRFTMKLALYVTFNDSEFSELDYDIKFVDSANSWSDFLGLTLSSYNEANNGIQYIEGADYSLISATKTIKDLSIKIDSTNNTFIIKPQSTVSGLYTNSDANTISIKIPNGFYTKSQLYSEINTDLNNNPISKGSIIQSIWDASGNEYVKLRLNLNKIYTSKDYSLTFYNFTDYVSCLKFPNGNSSLSPIPWTATLGWMLGFHTYPSYDLNNETDYYVISNNYTNDPKTNIVTLTGDTSVDTNTISNLYITVEDYAQNHINDGIVTVAPPDSDLELPAYTSSSTAKCDPTSPGTALLSYDNMLNPGELLTANQFYAASVQQNNSKDRTNILNMQGPSVKNILATVFLNKLPAWQQKYVDNGGSNLNQDRKYFGPVNISRMTLQLVNDQGYLVDLNGADWSVTLLCDSLYTAH